MSEDNEGPEPIPFGVPVVITRVPVKTKASRGNGCAVGLVVVGLVAVFLFLNFASCGSNRTSSAPTPTNTPAFVPNPTAFPGAGEATATLQFSPLTSPAAFAAPTAAANVSVNTSSFSCQPGIRVGNTATVVAAAVRIRSSPGFSGKNDDTDTVGFLRLADVVNVLDGPDAIDGLCWWLVEHVGMQGWSADQSQDGTELLTAGR